MLSKHIFSQRQSLFVAAGIAVCGLGTVSQSANALSIRFLNQTGTNYDYVVDVESTDMWSTTDLIEFSGLLDIDGATITAPGPESTGPATTFFRLDSFDSDSVTFMPNFDWGGGLSGTLGRLSITSDSTAGPMSVSFAGFSATNIPGPVNAVVNPPINPPNSNSVPFEFSPGLGLILSGTLLGGLKLRSKFGKKEEINF